ncbi:hypothetical protein MNBD_GAMMA18-221 [hydrothermal vent metagenome]|uniref:Uncharacterized protein n=1 Tax=hydrothermal vent metagenome TaxID=652676 RepID=A0A3B0Z4Q9_9ZZZZ
MFSVKNKGHNTQLKILEQYPYIFLHVPLDFGIRRNDDVCGMLWKEGQARG